MGLDSIFMVTGRGALYLTDAAARSDKIRGYSYTMNSRLFLLLQQCRLFEKIGCCIASTGCGSTNALTGVLNAWQDGVPLLILSGQHELNETTNYTNLPVRTYGSSKQILLS